MTTRTEKIKNALFDLWKEEHDWLGDYTGMAFDRSSSAWDVAWEKAIQHDIRSQTPYKTLCELRGSALKLIQEAVCGLLETIDMMDSEEGRGDRTTEEDAALAKLRRAYNALVGQYPEDDRLGEDTEQDDHRLRPYRP